MFINTKFTFTIEILGLTLNTFVICIPKCLSQENETEEEGGNGTECIKYRRPGFLAVVWFDPPLSRQQVVSLSQSSCVSPVELTDGGGGVGVAAKSYDVAGPL